MTTIAWDGKVLAGDTLADGGGVMNTRHKVYKLKNNILYGACGETQDCIVVRDWIEAGSNPKEKPSNIAEGFSALIIESGKIFLIENKLVRMEFHESILAIGSGAHYALAAIFLGLSSKEAVSLASKFDLYTNDIVTCVHL